MEKKQHQLCRMRDGWCRDCESSEYRKDCMEKETKHTPEIKYTGLTEFEGKVLEAMMGGRDNVLNNKLDSMEQFRLSLCAKGAAAFLQTELSEMKKEKSDAETRMHEEYTKRQIVEKEREELVKMIEIWVDEISSDIDNASGYKKLLLTNSKSLLNRIKK